MAPIALITGGSRGIGLGIAQALGQAGYRLAINGMRPEAQVLPTLDALRTLSPEVIYCQGNVGTPEGRHQIIDKVRTTWGELHLLVNNAGVAPKERKDLLEMSEESYDRVLEINLKGPFFLTQAIARWMLEQKAAAPGYQGCIINISSISATIVSINRGQYCISKSGMSMMTQLFATRLGEADIPVYELRPGVTATDMTAGVKEKYDQLIADGLCVQPRWGKPEDVGKAVVALAEGYFPYSTGQVIMVDGGLSIPRL